MIWRFLVPRPLSVLYNFSYWIASSFQDVLDAFMSFARLLTVSRY
jgi:hypothetical protein